MLLCVASGFGESHWAKDGTACGAVAEAACLQHMVPCIIHSRVMSPLPETFSTRQLPGNPFSNGICTCLQGRFLLLVCREVWAVIRQFPRSHNIGVKISKPSALNGRVNLPPPRVCSNHPQTLSILNIQAPEKAGAFILNSKAVRYHTHTHMHVHMPHSCKISWKGHAPQHVFQPQITSSTSDMLHFF